MASAKDSKQPKYTVTVTGKNAEALMAFRDFCKREGLVQGGILARLVTAFMDSKPSIVDPGNVEGAIARQKVDGKQK